MASIILGGKVNDIIEDVSRLRIEKNNYYINIKLFSISRKITLGVEGQIEFALPVYEFDIYKALNTKLDEYTIDMQMETSLQKTLRGKIWKGKQTAEIIPNITIAADTNIPPQWLAVDEDNVLNTIEEFWFRDGETGPYLEFPVTIIYDETVDPKVIQIKFPMNASG
jgi:hypothetical protein